MKNLDTWPSFHNPTVVSGLLKEAYAGVVSGTLLNILNIFIDDSSHLPWSVVFLPEGMVSSLYIIHPVSVGSAPSQVSKVWELTAI